MGKRKASRVTSSFFNGLSRKTTKASVSLWKLQWARGKPQGFPGLHASPLRRLQDSVVSRKALQDRGKVLVCQSPGSRESYSTGKRLLVPRELPLSARQQSQQPRRLATPGRHPLPPLSPSTLGRHRLPPLNGVARPSGICEPVPRDLVLRAEQPRRCRSLALTRSP
jgi:hypothetical protein